MQPMTLPYQPHSETSREAAEELEPKASTLRAKVLDYIRKTGRVTDEQLQEALNMNPSTQRPRRVELVKMGLICDSGTTAITRSGRRAVLWEAPSNEQKLVNPSESNRSSY